MLKLGSYTLYFGQRWTVGAVGCLRGERYYWLKRRGTVMMIPASVLARLQA